MGQGNIVVFSFGTFFGKVFWERMYPGYTLHYCEPIITGNNTRHLIVRLYRKETGMQQNRRNRP